MEERIKAIMKSLDCSREEALEILADDDAIEKGEKLFELTDAQKKASKDARKISRKPSEQKAKREKKADEEKRFLINLLEEALANGFDCSQIEVSNIERQIDFVSAESGRKFRIVLSAPRKQGLTKH